MNLWGGTDPTLVPGTSHLEKYDSGWLQCLTDYQESQRVPFPTGGTIINIPDTVTIALAGDWGNGTQTNVRPLIEEVGADYTIHLGDVYYSGREDEHGIFATDWPAGKLGSFVLCGNHDLYAGGQGYLNTLAEPKFAAQGGKSYFALRNKNWLIVGLDTTSASTSWLYKDGALKGEQRQWFEALLEQTDTRKLILLTHHDPFNLATLDETGERGDTGVIYKTLATDVGLLPVASYWYFAHVHSPIIYNRGYRCIGHAGVPYLPFPGIPSDYGDANVRVLWAETDTVAGTQRGPSGFAVLRLDGPTITEQLVDEAGRSRWSA